MSTIRVCDQCEAKATAATNGEWVHLQSRLPSVLYKDGFTVLGEDAPPTDFCSWGCVREYAAVQAGET